MPEMKTVTVPRGYRGLHIEIPGAIVNITTGLHNDKGQEVTHINVMADQDRYMGDPEWWAEWGHVDRIGGTCRIIQEAVEPSCPHCGAGPPDAKGELPHFRDCQEA